MSVAGHQEGQQIGEAIPRGDASGDVAPLLDAKGAAALLNVPASWVLAEARADRIPHVRLGRYVRFDVGELNAWWLSRRRGPWRSTRKPIASAHSPASDIRRAA